MNSEKLLQVAHTVAEIAASLEKKVFYFLIIATASSILIAWQWINFGELSVGVFLKILFLSFPLLLWFCLFSLLKQLIQLPESLHEIKKVGEDSLALASNINSGKRPRKSLIGGLFGLIKTLREPEIFEHAFVCVKGLSLLMNPVSLLALILSTLLLIIFIMVALFISFSFVI